MKDDQSSPERLLRDLGSSPVPLAPAEQLAGRRERVVAAMDRAFVNAFAERSARRWAAPIAAAAAILVFIGAGFLWALWPRTHQAVAATGIIQGVQGNIGIARSGTFHALGSSDRAALVRSDRVRTERASIARVTLPSGATVRVEPLSDVGFDGEPGAPDFLSGERADLTAGRVDVQVPHLKQGMTFSVQTPNALVVVHGTRFSVEVLRAAGEVVTNVEVTEGRVSVRHAGREIFLEARSRWSSAGNLAAPRIESVERMHARSDGEPDRTRRTTPPNAMPPAGPDPAHHAENRVVHSTASDAEATSETSTVVQSPAQNGASPAEPTDAEKASTLAEQNRLFAAAMFARRQGDDVNTIGYLDALIEQFPDSPLAQDARVERFRAQKRLELTRKP